MIEKLTFEIGFKFGWQTRLYFICVRALLLLGFKINEETVTEAILKRTRIICDGRDLGAFQEFADTRRI